MKFPIELPPHGADSLEDVARNALAAMHHALTNSDEETDWPKFEQAHDDLALALNVYYDSMLGPESVHGQQEDREDTGS